jgi:hypothetical protein
MKNKTKIGLSSLALTVALVSLAAGTQAKADSLGISIQSPLTAIAGSSGNQFDVLLTNLGTTSVTIAAFTFELSTTSSDVSFTGVDTTTGSIPYIFAGSSLFGPNITATNTGQDVSASDLFSVVGSGITLAAGQRIALGDVLFNVSATAPTETASLALAGFPSTSLSDELGNNLDVTSLAGGNILISRASSVSESKSVTFLIIGIAAIFCTLARKRFSPTNTPTNTMSSSGLCRVDPRL